jgi:hypothetical protein
MFPARDMPSVIIKTRIDSTASSDEGTRMILFKLSTLCVRNSKTEMFVSGVIGLRCSAHLGVIVI